MKKIELLSPAGDMERLKMSVLYGADAVYLAGTDFGMRSFAGNFTPEEMPEAVKFHTFLSLPIKPVCAAENHALIHYSTSSAGLQAKRAKEAYVNLL